MIERFAQFSSSVSCIYKTIQKLEREEMARFGLKGPHAQCLLVMKRYPEGIIISQLCELCEKDKAAISRTVAELEEKGMVERVGGSDRAYRAPLRLTEEGRRTTAHVSGIVERAVEMAGRGLTDADRRVFYPALDLIAGNLLRLSREGIPENEEI